MCGMCGYILLPKYRDKCVDPLYDKLQVRVGTFNILFNGEFSVAYTCQTRTTKLLCTIVPQGQKLQFTESVILRIYSTVVSKEVYELV